MTTRSTDSRMSARRHGRDRISDDDVYDYALRVSYLSYLMQPKATEPPPNGDVKDSPAGKEHFRLSGVTSSIMSIGDLFKDAGRDGQKTVRFPEKLLKALDQKMQNIAMGKDPGYTDQLIRRTIAVFWSSLKDPNFHKQMKENRKIEELILMFVTTSTGALRKDPTLPGDAWKSELNNQIAQFIRILRETLRTVNGVPPELTARLDMYTAKLVPAAPDAGKAGAGEGPSHRDSAAWTPSYSTSVADMPLVKTVARLFGKTDQEAQKDIHTIRRFCTEKAALADLKTCLKNITSGAPFPGRREDFDSDEAYQQWRTTELAQLSQLMVIMVQFNPELAKSTPSEVLPAVPEAPRPMSLYSPGGLPPPSPPASRNGSVSSRYSMAPNTHLNTESLSEAIQHDDETPAGHNFTFIPQNPKRFYKRLLELGLQYDLEAMGSLPEDQEVSLGILSPRHLEVINECAVRWRIMQSFRVTAFLDVIKYKYEREEVPMECIPEALGMIAKTSAESPPSNWPVQDAEYLAAVYGSLFNLFLGSLYHALEDIPALKMDSIAPYLTVLDAIQASHLVERYDHDIHARVQDLIERVRVIAVQRYTDKSNDFVSQAGVNRALPLLMILEWMEKQAKVLNKRFPEPILGQIDIVPIMLEAQVPLFLTDLDNARRRLMEGTMVQPTPDVPIEDIFTLYRRTLNMIDMHGIFCEGVTLDFDLVGYFEPYVRHWLQITDARTSQWVHGAISVDTFEAVGKEGHSSSIVDLFDSLKSALDFLLDLKWPDAYQEARFLTALSKSINKCMEQYCSTVEEMFMEEMFPRPPPELAAPKQSAWLEKAKLTIQGEKKVEPFNFAPASCVRLNNIEAARGLLDKMSAKIDADKVAEIVRKNAPAVPEKSTRLGYLFAVKIVSAEGLVAADGGPSSKLDTFVTLSDEKGVRLAKTRTIYESSEPKWDETVDITVETHLWLMVSVRDRALIGKHDTVGRAYLNLEPRRFGDFLSHELWLDLDTAGRILLRVSMEGEKDDIQFYFGRGFRALKRAEGDMSRVFVDKMSPFIKQCLSRATLRSLVKPALGGITLDRVNYNKALGGVQALYRSALGGGGSTDEPVIPLPQEERPRFKPDALSDDDIIRVIKPLIDYFDMNLATLNMHLSESTKETVMKRVWKEVLAVIEGLLIPPLSDLPSDMKPLSEKEVDVVFKWLQYLYEFFYIEGEGLPLEVLKNQRYGDIVSIRYYYDWHTDNLMEECVRMMQQSLRAAPTLRKRGKSVYQQRNLGTIKMRKREKREQQPPSNGEVIMRILRMRPNTTDFLSQQLQIISMQAQQAERAPGPRRVDSSQAIPLPPMREPEQ